jgi:biopolymer transport protein ExbB/TolQ
MGALLEVFQNLGLAGKIIVFVLVVMSIYMWGLIAAKWIYLSTVERGNQRLLERLRGFDAQFARDYLQLMRDVPDSSHLPVYKLYRACCEQLFVHDNITPVDVMAAEKVLDARLAEQVVDLEDGLTYLSITSMCSPFLGLLGTVWGIMVAFRRMTQVGSTTISTVAPGIAVALVTTIVGLIVAIPAVVAFYSFRQRANRQLVLMETFGRELIARIERHVHMEVET